MSAERPLLQMRGVDRRFPSGDSTVTVLRDIDLTIHSGEMVAIVGASGSGKSTLMNILGCLDRPSSGSYQIDGRETAERTPDELAALRRERFGFIFQRYNLLADMSAIGNVELPAIYAGTPAHERHAAAQALLQRLGLGDRMDHSPGQLSGGQQQRVSIARALINGGAIILADEPTGALDSASGEEVIRILKELNAAGHTIIIVTHDMSVAAHAPRRIEIHDGAIVGDTHAVPAEGAPLSTERQPSVRRDGGWFKGRDRFVEALRMALRAMLGHRLRTFLTMLGIIIGIASVVLVVALGRGAQNQVLSQIGELGTNTLDIFPGKDFGDTRAAAIDTLVSADATALAEQPYVDSATPNVSAPVTARYGSVTASGQVSGVDAAFMRVRGLKLASGRWFDQSDVDHHAQVAVLDQRAAKALFAHEPNPVGQVVLLDQMPVEVIGVLQPSQSQLGSSTPTFHAPFTAVSTRLTGSMRLDSITLRIKDGYSAQTAQKAVKKLLTGRHGTQDFFIFSSDQIRGTIERTSTALTLLISSIAMIALLVGGIGVMNIMLVSVTERTREIGVRMAIGARQSDILQQFLIEAVLVCLIGGALGVALAVGLGTVFNLLKVGFSVSFSVVSIAVALACSSLIGIAFGFLPARNAARLDPVQALSRN